MVKNIESKKENMNVEAKKPIKMETKKIDIKNEPSKI